MMYDLVIIGSGPAGLSAAVYAKRAGLDVVVLEKNPMSGGQVLTTYEVDNYLGLPGIGGYDMGVKFREHADRMEVPFITEEVIGIETAGACHKVITEAAVYETKTVILAMGASHARLGVPGEEKLAGMGVSYCATCDGAFFRNRTVAVVGGGDVAVEDAIFLARNCAKVYLIHRREELRAARVLQEALMQLPNVEILWNSVVEEIQGEDAVEQLALKNVKTGEPRILPVQGVFVAVGILPQTEAVKEIISCNQKGYIEAGEDCATDVPGIYVAGDARTKPMRQIITAVADGANAATSASQYVAVHK